MAVSDLVLSLVETNAARAQTVSVVYTFNGGDASQYPEGALAQGINGDLYGTTVGSVLSIESSLAITY